LSPYTATLRLRCVDCLHDVVGIAKKHYAVVDDRRRLVNAGLHYPCPDELQILDVGLIDLLKRAVTPALIVAAASTQSSGFGLRNI
jgi:hypothetical protein